MAKIAVIGICGQSVFMNVDHFHESGETLTADSIHEEIGGKGINQAIAAHRMGAEVSFLAAIGDDEYGRICLRDIKANGVNAELKLKKGMRTPVAFILTDKHGENRVTVHGSSKLTVEDVRSFEKEIAASDILLLQQEVPMEINETAVEIARAHGIKVILNPAPAGKNSDKIAEYVFAVTPNEQEEKFVVTAGFQNRVTTMGKHGCCINGSVKVPALDVMPVDTTGAGDTFNGVLAVCIAEGKNLEESCKYAVAASGISVGRKHVIASIPSREEVERTINENNERKGQLQ